MQQKSLRGKCTIRKNYAKYDLNTFKNKYAKYFIKIIFLDHSSKIYLFPHGVGHGVQREGNKCEELDKTTKRWKLECREELIGVPRGGERNAKRRKQEWNH